MDTGTTGYGRKYTSTKHDDELSRVDWREFERMMARWYASRGYDVDHRGTASSGRRTDGGIDLVLTGHGEKVLVQCKHAKVLQVPYTEAMQLFGLVHAEKADRAILITTGEFTREALRKARKVGQLEMIDGKELRRRLGPDIAWLRDGAA
jgi:restriction system protein